MVVSREVATNMWIHACFFCILDNIKYSWHLSILLFLVVEGHIIVLYLVGSHTSQSIAYDTIKLSTSWITVNARFLSEWKLLSLFSIN